MNRLFLNIWFIFSWRFTCEDNQRTKNALTQELSEAVVMPFLMAEMVLSCAGMISLIILDNMLPGMDGWQILQTLEQQKQTLLLPARDSIDSRSRAEQWGKWLSSKTFSFWVAGKGSGWMGNITLWIQRRNQWLKMDSVDQSEADNISITQRAEFQLLWLLYQNWRDYTQWLYE